MHSVEYINPGQILINCLWPLLAFYFTSHHQLNWLFIEFVLNVRFILSFSFCLHIPCTVAYTLRNRNEDASGSGQQEDMRLYWACIGVALLVFAIVLLTFDHTSSRQLTEKQLHINNINNISIFILFIAIDLLDNRLYFWVFFRWIYFLSSYGIEATATVSYNAQCAHNVQNVTRSGYIIWMHDALLVACIGNRIMLFCWWCGCLFPRSYWAILTNYFDYHRCWASGDRQKVDSHCAVKYVSGVLCSIGTESERPPSVQAILANFRACMCVCDAYSGQQALLWLLCMGVQPHKYSIMIMTFKIDWITFCWAIFRISLKRRCTGERVMRACFHPSFSCVRFDSTKVNKIEEKKFERKKKQNEQKNRTIFAPHAKAFRLTHVLVHALARVCVCSSTFFRTFPLFCFTSFLCRFCTAFCCSTKCE